MLTPLQEQSLAFLAVYEQRRAVYDAANNEIQRIVQQDLKDDFSGLQVKDIDGDVLTAMCELLDAIWGVPGSDLASYYLHECIGPLGHGGCYECCGQEWKLRNIEELRAYLIHCNTCAAGKVA